LKTSGIALDEGDTVTITAGGGGGYGNPLERNAEEVRRDVINGYVTPESAKRDYGAAI
jgi:N-methylhydantoinase B